MPVSLVIALLAILQAALAAYIASQVIAGRLPFSPRALPTEQFSGRASSDPGVLDALSRIGGQLSSLGARMETAVSLLTTRLDSLAGRAEYGAAEHFRAAQEQIARLEKDLTELAALQENPEADNNRSAVHEVRSAVAELTLVAERLSKSNDELGARVARLQESFDALIAERPGPAPDRPQPAGMEHSEPDLRIESASGAGDQAAEPAVDDTAVEPSRSIGARVISLEGRRKFGEVLALYRDGRDIETISMMTGLDSAEIQLMVVGEPDPGR